jgi:pimeloyl-ACP methyl ester carboxylesterase
MRPAHRALLTFALSATLLGACGSSTTPSATAPSTAPTTAAAASAAPFVPTFATEPCPDDVTANVVVPVTCGYLTALEDRSRPAGRTIQVFVARLDPPGGTTTPDPVITLGHLATQDGYGDMAGGGQRTHRVLYLVDPRGIGHSTPSLDCPEVPVVGPAVAGFRLRDPARQATLLAAVTACHDRLVAQGIDLAAYDLAANAADLEDLRAALGIGKWNLMTNGDASRLAFEVARRYPAGLRSLIIDSPSLPSPDFLTIGPTALDAAIARLVSLCTLDAACARAYPDVATEIRTAIKRLDEHPATIDVSGTVEAIRLGHPIRIVVDGAALVRIIRWGLGSSGGSDAGRSLQEVRDAIDGSLSGADTGVVALASDAGDCLGLLTSCERPNLGALYSIVCRDLATPDASTLQPSLDGRPAYTDVFSPSPLLTPCRAWGVPPAAPFASAGVTGGVPTLVLRGVLDPYSAPTADVVRATAGATNVYALDIPNQSYNALGYSDCPRAIRGAWIDAPTQPPADTSCLNRIPAIQLTGP